MKVVLWGLRWKKDSFRYIYAGWYRSLKRSGYDVTWVSDSLKARDAVTPGSIVFAVNVAAHYLPIVNGCTYVLHNLGADDLPELRESRAKFLNLQVWTNGRSPGGYDSAVTCADYDPVTRTLFQPWGTPFHPSEWTGDAIAGRAAREWWIGSVWNNSLGQGNETAIADWRTALSNAGISFSRAPKGWPDRSATYGYLVRRSRLAAAIVGDWQRDHGYLPCRMFKNVSFGAIPVGNTAAYAMAFGEAALVEEDLPTLVDRYLAASNVERGRMVAHAQEILHSYTYEAGLDRIFSLAREV